MVEEHEEENFEGRAEEERKKNEGGECRANVTKP